MPTFRQLFLPTRPSSTQLLARFLDHPLPLLDLLLDPLVTPEPLSQCALPLFDHVRVHDVQAWPPDDEEEAVDVLARRPMGRAWELGGERREDEHRF